MHTSILSHKMLQTDILKGWDIIFFTVLSEIVVSETGVFFLLRVCCGKDDNGCEYSLVHCWMCPVASSATPPVLGTTVGCVQWPAVLPHHCLVPLLDVFSGQQCYPTIALPHQCTFQHGKEANGILVLVVLLF